MKKLILIIYLVNWGVFTILFLIQDMPLSVLFTKDALLTIHALFIIISLPICLVKYLFDAKKEKKLRLAFKRILLRFLLPLGLCIVIIKCIVTYNQTEDFHYNWDYTIENTKEIASDKFNLDSKLRGMSAYAVGRNRKIKLNDLVKSNVEWIAVHPYMSQLNETSYNMMSQPAVIGQWSKRDSAFIKGIREAKAKNFRIMLKPHLWVNSGWRANIRFDSDADWNVWFTNYKTNMLHYAKLAEYAKVELFCIGTELRSTLKNKSDKWLELIDEIRQIYSGKLTYASNWDDNSFYNNPKFWKAIDYIGIQAYYPLTTHKNPDLDDIKKGWNRYIVDLKKLHKTYNKPIIFTELGYRPDAEATVEPWEWYSLFSKLQKKKSYKTQLLAYEAFFQKVWNQDWFAGVFIWQWNNSYDFSVRGKPAQNNISKWYSKINLYNNE